LSCCFVEVNLYRHGCTSFCFFLFRFLYILIDEIIKNLNVRGLPEDVVPKEVKDTLLLLGRTRKGGSVEQMDLPEPSGVSFFLLFYPSC